MNKYLVEEYIKLAYESISESKNEKKSNNSSSIKAQIATFGAAISSGSLLSAIAFFSNPKKEKEDEKASQNKKEEEKKDPKDINEGSDKAKEDAKEIRIYLLNRIYDVILKHENKHNEDDKNNEKQGNSPLFTYVLKEIREDKENEVTEKVLCAAIAVKLALNLFD